MFRYYVLRGFFDNLYFYVDKLENRKIFVEHNL